MSKHHLTVTALAGLVLAVLACNTPAPTPTLLPRPTIAPTRATMAPARPSVAAPATGATGSPTVAPTRPPLRGSISGKLCYPGSEIPPMTIYAVNKATGQSFKVKSGDPGDTRYRIEGVLPGTYTVYAWLDDGKLGGSFSKAVPCGLSVDCTDHSLLPVTVNTGQDVTGIDVCDWYGPPPPAPPK